MSIARFTFEYAGKDLIVCKSSDVEVLENIIEQMKCCMNCKLYRQTEESKYRCFMECSRNEGSPNVDNYTMDYWEMKR